MASDIIAWCSFANKTLHSYHFLYTDFLYDWQILLTAGAPRVGIIMGSDSDLPVMKDAAKILREFNVPTEVIAINCMFVGDFVSA